MKCPKCDAPIKDESSICLICISDTKKMVQTEAKSETNSTLSTKKNVFFEAKDLLSGNEVTCFVVVIIYAIIVFLINRLGSINPIIGIVLMLVITSTLAVGVATFFLNISRRKEASVFDLFSKFNVVLKSTALFYLIALLIMSITFVIELSGIPLFIAVFLLVPSIIIITIPFVFAPYILSDYPKLSLFRLLRLSASFMKANLIRYIGVILLSSGIMFIINIALGFIIPIIASGQVNNNILIIVSSLPGMYVSFVVMTSIAVMYRRSLEKKEEIINAKKTRNKIVETMLVLALLIVLSLFTVALAFMVWENNPINQIDIPLRNTP